VALLDVNDAFGPEMMDPLVIDRRLQAVGANGRVVITTTRIDPKPLGVIVPKDSVIGGNFILREPDEQHRGAALVVFTTFRLQGVAAIDEEAVQFQPDVLWFNGDPYVVGLINDFSQWGRGFIQAELSSMASVDYPPDTDHA